MHVLRWLLLVIPLFLVGCESRGYYSQAMRGHFALMRSSEPVDRLLQDPALDPLFRQRLNTLNELRTFAESQLALPVGKNYADVVQQDSPFVAWNVFAAPEFSMDPKQWCYPVAGCSSYRGYFSRESAMAYADTMRRDGWDVYVGGVTAYSTLGWFNDPILSSMLERDSWQLASVLFHELAHQVVYVAGDTQFNESFATTVEREGLRRWMDAVGFGGPDRSAVLLSNAQDQHRRDGFVELVQNTVADLRVLYTADSDLDTLRRAKQMRIEQLRRDYALLKELEWEGYAGYDSWFSQPLNNAQLLTVATYNALVPAFQALLDLHEGDITGFYAAVADLAALDFSARRVKLESLLRL